MQISLILGAASDSVNLRCDLMVPLPATRYPPHRYISEGYSYFSVWIGDSRSRESFRKPIVLNWGTSVWTMIMYVGMYVSVRAGWGIPERFFWWSCKAIFNVIILYSVPSVYYFPIYRPEMWQVKLVELDYFPMMTKLHRNNKLIKYSPSRHSGQTCYNCHHEQSFWSASGNNPRQKGAELSL